MTGFRNACTLAAAALLSLTLLAGSALAEKVNLTFYFPVSVGGPITKIVEGMTEQFMKEHPDIQVTPVYAGIYRETLTKALTALRGASRRTWLCCCPPTCTPSSTKTRWLPTTTS